MRCKLRSEQYCGWCVTAVCRLQYQINGRRWQGHAITSSRKLRQQRLFLPSIYSSVFRLLTGSRPGAIRELIQLFSTFNHIRPPLKNFSTQRRLPSRSAR
ncbi:hypothetical protein PoB_001668800 [Plakobranchus ocellatus]|uniref:Uncharacterized protein n=1 Tax=Plakobranchus ocellatus TaxID=259542 RepID=A0AAV3Z651_9GAST|nr:hypothetical protein PoB_001668800 [Plakobranchus ocellatus]